MFRRHSGDQARDDKSDEKSPYSKHSLKEGPAEFVMDWMRGCGQNRGGLANSSPQANSTPPSVFVNKHFNGTEPYPLVHSCLCLLSRYDNRVGLL